MIRCDKSGALRAVVVGVGEGNEGASKSSVPDHQDAHHHNKGNHHQEHWHPNTHSTALGDHQFIVCKVKDEQVERWNWDLSQSRIDYILTSTPFLLFSTVSLLLPNYP